MKFLISCTLVLITLITSTIVRADTFGVLSPFEIRFVTIGDPGNPNDTTGNPNPAGKVDYRYRIGKYEVSEAMIDASNVEGGLGLTHNNRGVNKPATGLTWYEVAKFVNWLNTSTNHTAAYKFDGNGSFQLWQAGDLGFDPDNPFRNSNAKYFLPSADEWYKAAYYDPTAGVYYDYPTGSNSIPDGIDFSGDPDFNAVFNDGGFNPLPNDITDVGILSPYGTAGQGGNVAEWEETAWNLVNDTTFSARGWRGSDWINGYNRLSSSQRFWDAPAGPKGNVGFRVASVVPEPSSGLLGMLVAAGLMLCRRRSN